MWVSKGLSDGRDKQSKVWVGVGGENISFSTHLRFIGEAPIRPLAPKRFAENYQHKAD